VAADSVELGESRMSGDKFGVSLTELARIQKDWQSINERMTEMSKKVGQIKEAVAKAAATDLMASQLAGVVGFGVVAVQVARDVEDILKRTEHLQKTKERLTKEIGEDAQKIKQVIKEYQEIERRIEEELHKKEKQHQPPTSPKGGDRTGIDSTGPGHKGNGGGHHQPPDSPHHPGGDGGGDGNHPAPSSAGKIGISQVNYGGAGSWKSGKEACTDYINKVLDMKGITDPKARANWMRGMLTIAERESSFNSSRWLVNKNDSNAWGPVQSDGAPLHSSRGPWQCIPDTFASYHEAGTSTDIYDPVASCAASMNYLMGHYHVSPDGSNLAAKVPQANPNSGPHGY